MTSPHVTSFVPLRSHSSCEVSSVLIVNSLTFHVIVIVVDITGPTEADLGAHESSRAEPEPDSSVGFRTTASHLTTGVGRAKLAPQARVSSLGP